MTEMSPIGTVGALKPPFNDLKGDAALDILQTQGYPPFGVQMKITDDNGKLLPWDGTTFGRLKVSGPAVAKAYYRVDSNILDDAGFFDTGDVATIDADAYMRITDRSKDVIKSGGEWISSVELENELAAHPAVRTATVIGVPDDKWQERPLAVVVLAADRTGTAAELTEFLRARVAKWWLPERWAFVTDIPLTSTGKFDKKKLRRQFGDGDLIIETLA